MFSTCEPGSTNIFIILWFTLRGSVPSTSKAKPPIEVQPVLWKNPLALAYRTSANLNERQILCSTFQNFIISFFFPQGGNDKIHSRALCRREGGVGSIYLPLLLERCCKLQSLFSDNPSPTYPSGLYSSQQVPAWSPNRLRQAPGNGGVNPTEWQAAVRPGVKKERSSLP